MDSVSLIPCTAVTTDLVIFTIACESLKVLLNLRREEPFSGVRTLPGRIVDAHSGLTNSARQELQNSAGFEDIYLEQLYSAAQEHQIRGARVVSVAYFAVLPVHRPIVRDPGNDVQWYPVAELPDLPFDHEQLIRLAHRRLSDKLSYSTIAFQFLPEEFTLSALQSVYETVLNERLDKRNFRKRMRALDCIEETGRLARTGSHRPAGLFRAKAPGRVEIIK